MDIYVVSCNLSYTQCHVTFHINIDWHVYIGILYMRKNIVSFLFGKVSNFIHFLLLHNCASHFYNLQTCFRQKKSDSFTIVTQAKVQRIQTCHTMKFKVSAFQSSSLLTLIFKSLYLCNPMSQTLDISNYEFHQIKYSKFEISTVYTIQLQRYRDQNIRVCGKDSIQNCSGGQIFS